MWKIAQGASGEEVIPAWGQQGQWLALLLSEPSSFRYSTLTLTYLPPNSPQAPNTAFYVPLSSRAHHLQTGPMKSAGIGTLMLPTQMF